MRKRSDPNEGKDESFDFDPRDYTPEELDAIEAALKLMIAKRDEKRQRQAGLGEASAVDEDTGEVIEAEVFGKQKARR